MAGQRHSPNREANQQAFYEARERAIELARVEREERRRLLAAPIPWKCGAHSKYTGKVADEICNRLISGETLTMICRDDKMPSYPTVIKWLRDHEQFRIDYGVALELSAHCEADMMSHIRRAAIAGDIESDVARVSMDASKWLAKMRNNKLYGDKGGDQLKGNPEVPPILNITLSKA